MTLENENPISSNYQYSYLRTASQASFPYSHYFHHYRSDSSPANLPAADNSSTTAKQLVDGYMNASAGSGQGIHLKTGGQVGGKHGLGLNTGGHVAKDGAELYANGHLGPSSYGIQAQGTAHLDTDKGLGIDTGAAALGKYGVAAQAKTQVGGGQGAGFHTGANVGGEYGLQADAEGHLGVSQGAGFNAGLQIGGHNGLGAQAQAQLGGGQGAGLGVTGQLGSYNGGLGFTVGGGKGKDSKHEAE